MAIVRQMLETDVDAVRRIDAAAFNAYNLATGKPTPVAERTRENILANLAANPTGCFIAEDEIGPAGFIFSHVWGQVGWVGVFGVPPERQKQGIGRELLDAAVRSLETAGCTTIGLETMPDMPDNIGLYARNDFRPAYTTLVLQKVPGETQPEQPHHHLAADNAADLAAVARISRGTWGELDYSSEAQNALRFGWGETLLIGEPEPAAAVIVRTAQRREGPTDPVTEISALAALPAARPWLDQIIHVVEAFARERGSQFIRLPINTIDWDSLRMLLGMGFRVTHSGLRFIRTGAYPLPAGIDLSRWAM